MALVVCFLLLCVIAAVHSALIRAPSIFRSDEQDMHKYSAVLAATEPFRVQCEEQIRRTLNPISYTFRRLLGKSALEVGEREREKNAAIDVAMTRFEVRVQNALRSYGMEVGDFNSLSELISKEAGLKKRVLLQSYLYKLAADLEFNLKKVMPLLPAIGQRGTLVPLPMTNNLPSNLLQKDNNAVTLLDIDDDTPEITRFARALSLIESERIKIRDRIKRELHIRDLPPRMADPEYLPAMCPTIQKACKDFPNLANYIIRKNGLHVEEFNLLQEKLAKNFIFRYQVQREIRKVNKNGDLD